MSIRILTAVFVFALLSTPVHAQCIRQSKPNHDYCGPEASKLARLVPDFALGNFRNACARHDACYQFGGEAIVRKMESRYRMSMISATSEQKREFRSDMRNLQKKCDRDFRSNLLEACRRFDINCRHNAQSYYTAVRALGSKWFSKATDNAFSCRTR